jgi:hypothetical protein
VAPATLSSGDGDDPGPPALPAFGPKASLPICKRNDFHIRSARQNDAGVDRPAMGFNRRKMDDQRRRLAEKEAAVRRATDAQVLEDAEHLIGAWNERAGPSSCRCCSRRRSALRWLRGFGSYGYTVRRAERSTRSICAHSSTIATRQ